MKGFIALGLLACSSLANASYETKHNTGEWYVNETCSAVQITGEQGWKQVGLDGWWRFIVFDGSEEGTYSHFPAYNERNLKGQSMVFNGKRINAVKYSSSKGKGWVFEDVENDQLWFKIHQHIITSLSNNNSVKVSGAGVETVITGKGFKKAWKELEACQL